MTIAEPPRLLFHRDRALSFTSARVVRPQRDGRVDPSAFRREVQAISARGDEARAREFREQVSQLR